MAFVATFNLVLACACFLVAAVGLGFLIGDALGLFEDD